MNATLNADGSVRRGLSSLAQVPVTEVQERLLDELALQCPVRPALRSRIRAEARDLLALVALTRGRRLRVVALGTSDGDLRARIEMSVPVPVSDAPNAMGGTVRIESAASLLVLYPSEAILRSLPGTSFVLIAKPLGVFHANVSPGFPQILCLGPRLPAGVRLVELLVLSFQALALQGTAAFVGFDVRNPAGVLNPVAAAHWQDRAAELPLTREAFVPA